MNRIKYLDTPFLFLEEKGRLNARKTLKREDQRENHSSSHSSVKGWAHLSTLVAALVAWVVLVACPATPGASPSPRYLCENGTPSSLRDTTADGLTRCVSCNPLYRLDGTTDVVGTSCQQVALGEVTRIGIRIRFGVDETEPRGLAAIGGTLYMVGDRNDVLYTINIDPDDMIPDGMAIKIGSLPAGFGVGEAEPEGLAAIDDTLYMVGWTNRVLYTLNIADDMTPDGMAIQVGNLPAGFDVGEQPEDIASIGTTLYMLGTANKALYILNIDSTDMTPDGKASRVGGASSFGVDETIASALTAIDDTLYMAGYDNRILYTLNIADDMTPDGMAIQVGSVPSGFGVNEGAPEGLADIDGILYMVGARFDILYALRYQ